MNEVLKAIAQRSSIRAYKDKQLTHEEINALITAGLQAPTARNAREVHITAVEGSNSILKELEEERRRIISAQSDLETKNNLAQNPNNFYYDAPAVFMLSADRNFKWSKVDAGIAVQSIALAAQSMGLGSLIIGIIDSAMKGDKKEYFEKMFKFPPEYEFVIAVAVGYKNTDKLPHDIDFDRSVSFV